jgi:hypothetical protein
MTRSIKEWTREDIIEFDIRNAWLDEQKKRKSKRQTYEQVAAGVRAVYDGTNPYMACPVETAVIDI